MNEPAHAGLAAAINAFLATGPEFGDMNAYLAARYDAGLANVDWPAGLGGLGLDRALQPELEAALVAAGAPVLWGARNPIGLGMAAPVLLSFGTREQQERSLKRIWTAEDMWCQLFSEPGAGSDLASLGTSAVRTGNDWLINGQKVWTSLAHQSRWALLVTRSDRDVPKHKGMTFFICDMTAPGVDVRPLRQLTGEAEFNEVFLTDVVIADSERVGAVGEGWKVATGTLMNERVSIAGESQARGSGIIGELESAWHSGAKRPELRENLIELWIEAEQLRLLNIQLGQLRESGVPGPEGSGAKLAHSNLQQRASSFWLDLLGDDGLRYSDWSMRRTAYGSEGERDAGYYALRTRANSIEGGTSEIMRNIISERILRLPTEPRVDVDVAWKDLPR